MNYFVFILCSGSWEMNFSLCKFKIIFQCITGQFYVKSSQSNRHSWGQDMEKNCFFSLVACLGVEILSFFIVDRFNTYLSFLSGWYNNHKDFFLLLWLISLEREMKYKARLLFNQNLFHQPCWSEARSFQFTGASKQCPSLCD
jgi:hypothetical protein